MMTMTDKVRVGGLRTRFKTLLAAATLGVAVSASAVTVTVICNPSDGTDAIDVLNANGNSYIGVTTSVTIPGLTAGDTFQVVGRPGSGRAFLSWSTINGGSISATANPGLFTVSATDSFLYGNFGLPQVPLTMLSDGNEATMTPSVGSTTFHDKDSDVNIATTPDPGFTFRFWGYESVAQAHANVADPLSESTTISMVASNTVRAYFSPVYVLTMNAYSGPGTAPVFRDLAENQEYTAQVSSEIVPDTSIHRYICIGWNAGSGDISPAGNAPSYGPYTVTQDSAMTWQWDDLWRLYISTTAGGTTSPGANTNHWYRDGESVTLTASSEEGYVFAGWYQGNTLLAQGTLTLTMDQAYTLQARFALIGGDSDDDGMSDTWESKYGLDPNDGSGVNGADGDPDNDRLTNIQEYQIQLTNSVVAPFQFASPINGDTDGDGMDDGYERFSIDPQTTGTGVGQDTGESAVSAVLDDGRYDVDNGPLGNPDNDYYWSTVNGYADTNDVLRNIEEWTGPDAIVPGTFEDVASGATASDGWFNPLGVTVRRFVNNIADTDDQSKGNDPDTDNDSFDDGFEFAWDVWQQANSASAEVFVIGYRGESITNIVPVWDGAASITRRFNPNDYHDDVSGTSGDTDNDVLYDYETGGVSANWYSDVYEYRAWEADIFSPDVAGAPHSIVRYEHPTWQRSSHPFLIDVDQDGLPDGYEVIFGYDPWSIATPGSGELDGERNPDGDYMAYQASAPINVHHQVYAANDFDPRTGYAAFYPKADQMPGPGTEAAPNTKTYANLDESRGADGLLMIAPLGVSANTEDATNPNAYDSDGDGIWDGWEAYVGLDPNSDADADANPDPGPADPKETLSNLDEFKSFMTSSTNRTELTPVTDWSNKIFPTDPNNYDTDGDGLYDSQEKGYDNGAFVSIEIPVATDDGLFITYSNTLVVAGDWGGKCYVSGGLNPTSCDTENDGLPDPWESAYDGTVYGTIDDAINDPDHDRVLNYAEYWMACTYHWQWDFWAPAQASYDSSDFFTGTPKHWDWYVQCKKRDYTYIPFLGKRGWYSSGDPGNSDSDEDGMDDYYEAFHGLNPLYGLTDLVAGRLAGRRVLGSLQTADPRILPYVTGSLNMDPDGDGLINVDEGMGNLDLLGDSLIPRYHTDPTPLWITDYSYADSWVNLYYTPPANVWFWGSPNPPTPPTYAYDVEFNEGYDTDNDNEADYDEVVTGSTDPVNHESPIKRRALYLPPGKDAYARTFANYNHGHDTLRRFTVESWVRPLNPASGSKQVIVDRPFGLYNGNPMGFPVGVRRNFQIALDENGVPFASYNGAGTQEVFVEAKAPATLALASNQWTHLAATYTPRTATSEGRLTLYVNGEVAAVEISNEIPCNGSFGSGDEAAFVEFAPLVVGAGQSDSPFALLFGLFMTESYFKGWVDEVRVWDESRSQSEIVENMYARLKQSDLTSGYAQTEPAIYMFTFDDLQDPDHDGIVPEGFALTMAGIGPTNGWQDVDWWASYPDASQVYTDYQYVPWIQNTAAHLPSAPPVDIGDTGQWGTDTNGLYTNTFINTGNPYGYYYLTATHVEIEDNEIAADMLPMLWAVADEDVEMWDKGGLGTDDTFDSDEDGMPDIWEEAYGFNPLSDMGLDGPYGDGDADGMGNLAEYLAHTGPWNYDTDGTGYSDFYSWSGVVYRIFGEIYTDFDGMHDEWEWMSGLDPKRYDAHQDADNDGFSNLDEMMASITDWQTGDIALPGETGYSDPKDDASYPRSSIFVTFNYDGVNNDGEIDIAGYRVASRDGNPDVRAEYPSPDAGPTEIIDVFPHVTTPFSGTIDLNHNTTNYFSPGDWWFFAFIDNNGDDLWDEGEPAGVSQADPVKLALGGPVPVTINLTDSLPGYKRFRWPAVDGVSEYYIGLTRSGINQFNPKVVVKAPRVYFHEGDYRRGGIDGLNKGTYQWNVYYYSGGVQTPVPGGSGSFTIEDPTPLSTPVLEWPLGASLAYAQEEFRWKMDEGATEFRLVISPNANLSSPVRDVTDYAPFRESDGSYRWTETFYEGVGGLADGVYYWGVQALSGSGNSSMSAAGSFTLNRTDAPQGPYSISGDVGYFGKVKTGVFVVEAYDNPVAGGEPVARVVMANSVNTNEWPKNEIPFELKGLRAGDYYLWSFLDQDGDRERDVWETYGFSRVCAYVPYPVTVPGSVTDVKIPITLTDTDNDKIADDWEYQYTGNLTTIGPGSYGGYTDQNPGGLNDYESYAFTPLNVSPFATNVAGEDGIPIWIKLAFDLSPWEYYAFAVTAIGVDKDGSTVVRWPVPQGSPVQLLDNGSAQIQNNGVTLSYRLQYSENLLTWTDLQGDAPATYDPVSGSFVVRDASHTNRVGFYRVLMSYAQ